MFETSEEIEELTNQEIFDLAMRKEEEENEMETRMSEEIISNKDALVSIDKLFKYFEQKEDFNEDDFNALIKIKNKVDKVPPPINVSQRINKPIFLKFREYT